MEIVMEDIGGRTYSKQVIGYWEDQVIAYDEETEELYHVPAEGREDLVGTYLEEGDAQPVAELPEARQEEIYKQFFKEVK